MGHSAPAKSNRRTRRRLALRSGTVASVALTFHLDFISPYAYLGWRKIHDVAQRHGQTVEAVPILFAALLTAHGHKGPAEIPSKRIYTFKHVVRLADELGVPLRPPPAHPFHPLLALRTATAAVGSERRRVVDALFDATWGGGGGVAGVDEVTRALDVAGLDGAGLVARAQTQEVKDALRAATDAALARGVFGVPTVWAGDEMFWGQDSFGHLERYLAGDDPAAPERIARWRDLPVGARR
jgi:2-hydroxychromene-2-carboxylate isomerase